MDVIKSTGQVFTPYYMINAMLDSIEFDRLDLMKIRIMEPSFGTGRFLCRIIERMIEYADRNKISQSDLELAIRDHIFGIEKDRNLYNQALIEIQSLLQSHNISVVPLNLICGDALIEYERFVDQIDLVIGNPPYVRIQNISPSTRELIRSFRFGQGNTDLYIQFYDIGLQMLRQDGVLCYITPNSFLKNNSQKKFRSYLLDQRLLDRLYNFKDYIVFDDVDTYCCVCTLSKKNKTSFGYGEIDPLSKLETDVEIGYDQADLYKNRPWIFGIKRLDQDTIKIRDIATVQYGISTNADRIYIGKAYTDEDCTKPYHKMVDQRKYVYFRGHRIEAEVLRKCVKASKCDQIGDPIYMIFPYEYDQEGCHLISETDLREKYPYTYTYLLSHRKQLEERDIEPNRPWYAFARSQGLSMMNKPKLVLKHMMPKGTGSIRVYHCLPDEIVYSGLFITGDLDRVKNALQTAEFKAYCDQIGKEMSGGYISVNGKAIANYPIADQIKEDGNHV